MMNMNAHNINILRYLLRKWALKQLLISVIVFYTSSCLLEHYVVNQYFPQFISDQVQDSLNEVFHSPTVFRMNYAEMEREFMVFVYQDRNITKYSDLPSKHNSKYESEEYFFSNLKMSPFLTDDAEEAHLFFIPIFSQKMTKKVRISYLEPYEMVHFALFVV
ncbi:PREDICTED: probable glycosyltransferase At5g03795 [Populus euphratica]|uniref:Probable glycosyltransferase At5g03795 n=1 Tax=Populus euphratica TaxID=75702 RepID=A0AAJ6T227_POPEU|nr:PREDICTED: probable glycosyltransferase At5g03795 [Populus euphratica]